MEKQTRRTFSADFKAKVMIEALRGRDTVETIARQYELHTNPISAWKKEFAENGAQCFKMDSDASEEKKQREAVLEKLYAQIGQQKVEIDWLKKN